MLTFFGEKSLHFCEKLNKIFLLFEKYYFLFIVLISDNKDWVDLWTTSTIVGFGRIWSGAFNV